jgi:thiamine biosynthesis lipoprotein
MSPQTGSLQGSTEARWEALGSTVVMRLTNAAGLPAARAAVEDELDQIDRACSRFREDSELVALNARAARPTPVSPLLLEAVALALRAAELTDGDVDPTLGRALELAGYDRDWQLLDRPRGEPEAPPAVTARVLSGWRTVELDREHATIRIPSGIKLDLGASAKAWAADRAAGAAAAAGCGALVSLGGDISTCGSSPAGGWRVHVTDDHRSAPDAPGQTITIRSGGLATSSTAVRRWSHEGHTMHHIIDPGTGLPVKDTWRTVSVAAADCADANIAATAALVRAAGAPAWLASSGLPARLLAWDGTVTTIGGWPAEELGEGTLQRRAA